MSDPRVPARIRRVLNVESGLNDGIATPIVLVAIAGVAADQGIEGVEGPGRAVVALIVGVLVGVVVGGAGGALTRRARRHGWLSEELAGPAVLVLPLLAYTGAVLVDGNGFVAAFVGGLVFGSTAGRGGEKEVYFVEQTGELASMVSWLIFGALTCRRSANGSGGQSSATRCSASPSSACCRLRCRCSAPASTASAWRSSAGSAHAGWPRSSSRCSPWRTCTTQPRRSSPPSH